MLRSVVFLIFANRSRSPCTVVDVVPDEDVRLLVEELGMLTPGVVTVGVMTGVTVGATVAAAGIGAPVVTARNRSRKLCTDAEVERVVAGSAVGTMTVGVIVIVGCACESRPTGVAKVGPFEPALVEPALSPNRPRSCRSLSSAAVATSLGAKALNAASRFGSAKKPLIR